MPDSVRVDNTKIVLASSEDIAIAEAIVNALGFDAAAELMFRFSIKSTDTVEVVNAAVERFGKANAALWVWGRYDDLDGNTPIDASERGNKDQVLQYMEQWKADLTLLDPELQARWEEQLKEKNRFWLIYSVSVQIMVVASVIFGLWLLDFLPHPSPFHSQAQDQIQQSMGSDRN